MRQQKVPGRHRRAAVIWLAGTMAGRSSRSGVVPQCRRANKFNSGDFFELVNLFAN
jgi:hypothetical protein